MANQYIRGRTKEWAVRDSFRDRGYKAERTAGSHGLFDVMAVNEDWVVLIQVKWSKTGKGWKDANFKEFMQLKVNRMTRKEVWVYTKGTALPAIHEI